MSDCPWPTRPDPCNDCWATIVYRLNAHPAEPILPQPGFCQDAAFVAYALDQRLTTIQHAGEIIRGEP